MNALKKKKIIECQMTNYLCSVLLSRTALFFTFSGGIALCRFAACSSSFVHIKIHK